MDIKQIQDEIERIQSSSYAKKTDKQLMAWDILSELYKQQCQGIQPKALVKYNDSENRRTKLNKEQVREIRSKYNPHIYGKKRLAIEFGVSVSVIYRIIKGIMWKNT
jgi:DNA invertase Pin-like site-specific DNA recombinase